LVQLTCAAPDTESSLIGAMRRESLSSAKDAAKKIFRAMAD
jgi:hypothetical protein